jgi:uncharacterized damage-inducible protein DinB
MTPDEAKVVLSFLADSLERESAATRRVISAVPNGQEEYSPDAKSMKALDLAWHIASSEQYFLESMVSGEFAAGEPGRPATIKNAQDVLAYYDEASPRNLARVRELTPEQCMKVLNFHDMFKMPTFAWAQLALTHAIHHRGQLSAYLRPMGAKVPSIYGPSGDVPIDALAKGA